VNTPKGALATVNEQIFEAEHLLTSHEVGALLQVNPSSINKWVNEGRLQAFRTPGGHRRIRAGDLVKFLDSYKMPIPRSLAGASRKRVLLVQDDHAQLAALQRVLKPFHEGIEVATADNGIDALVRVGSFRPHLIVLDIFMPELDGLEVCRRLKSSEGTRGIDVIVASGHLTKELEEKALEAGALRCVTKPIDLRAVLAELGLHPST
jgi:excisionase family DNA binding protein